MTMSGNKLVLIGLVLIALLFAGGVAAGAMKKDEPAADHEKKDQPDWTKAIDGVLSFAKGFGPRAELDDIKVEPPAFGSAKAGIEIPAGSECTLRVPGPDGKRILSLDLVVGDGLGVNVSAKINGKVKQQDYKPGEKATLAVHKGGLVVTVRVGGTQGFAKVTLE